MGLDGLTSEFFLTLKKDLLTIPCCLFQEIVETETFPKGVYKVIIILIAIADRYTQKIWEIESINLPVSYCPLYTGHDSHLSSNFLLLTMIVHEGWGRQTGLK